jgi:hypothetical protein
VLRRRSPEVDLDRVAVDRHGHAKLEVAAVGLENVHRLEASVGQLADRSSHAPLGVLV